MDRSPSADIEAIRQLVARYAFAIDSRDIVSLEKMFIPPADVSENAFVTPWVPSEGQAATARADSDPHQVAERSTASEQWRTALASFGPSFHFLGQHIIDIKGDEATGIAYAVCTHAVEPGPRWITVQLVYEDVYAFWDNKWLFKKRDMHGLRAYESPPSIESSAVLPFGPAHDAPDCWATWRDFWTKEKRDDTHEKYSQIY
ncbi:hypothetical protein JX265_004385 [Neoarthrinium moseri]|uniref:SnoaL-like domain-containing protein n=1 Tax=Neoarthrinium moseri TaxID=1658444 RepID=A0A9P9WQS5_9PEZI|nr:hypothetical protein JX265_004385 [Neoarthrinium moseri]